MDRLLTEEERAKCGLHTRNLSALQVLRGAPIEIRVTEGLQAQDTKTHQATLKEVGEWLEQIEDKAELGSRLSVLESAIEALKHGEMPE